MTKEKLRKIMGENIRNERLARNMSIDELAELLELTPGFVGLIERGRRGATAYTLYKLSDIFAMQVDELFSSPEDNSLRVAEQSSNPAKVKRSKINSMLYDLKEVELDFVITMIKEVKNMHNTIQTKRSLLDEDSFSVSASSDDEETGVYLV